MDYYRIANLTVAMEGLGEALLKQVNPYKASVEGKADISIRVEKERISKAIEQYDRLTPDEWEYIYTGLIFSHNLLDFEGFCLHASAVSFNGKAVLFSAPCGTGKSTHTGLWRKYFGEDQAVIINDDKPALRLEQDTFYAYGTPWSGKSYLNTNVKVPLQAVVFLEQAEKNHIRRLSSREAVQLLVSQSLRPSRDAGRMEKLLYLLDALLAKIPVYQMHCTISLDAVRTVHSEISHEKAEE